MISRAAELRFVMGILVLIRGVSAGEQSLTYGYGEPGAIVCPTGMQSPTDSAGCQAAATALGQGYAMSNSYEYYPKGCYQYTGSGSNTNKFFFNTHTDGSSHPAGRPVCHTAYYLDLASSNACSPGLARIDSEDACELAAGALGFTFAASNNLINDNALYPRGCYQLRSSGSPGNNKFFFNPGPRGKPNGRAVLVCQDSFALTTGGNSECPLGKGLAEIESAATCEVAAAALDRVWEMSNAYQFYPRGCYQFLAAGPNQDRFFFNTHGSGAAHASAGAVCRRAYELLPAGSPSCSSPTRLSPGACQAASTALGQVWAMANDYLYYPSGCMQYTGSGPNEDRVFYNVNLDNFDTTHASARPICLGAVTTTSTTTEFVFVGSAPGRASWDAIAAAASMSALLMLPAYA